MKIGLLLGSFDPIHIGHLHIASCVLNGGFCDKVLFVVAKHNPCKDKNPAPFEVRCQMVEAAIRDFDGRCEVCRFEGECEGEKVYSYIPIGMALEAYPNDELYVICGEDTLQKVPEWRNFKTHIKDKVTFIEISRGDTHTFKTVRKMMKANADDWSHLMFGFWMSFNKRLTTHFFHKIYTQRIDVSSTMIRCMIKGGMSPIPYVNKEVYDIIKQNNLYCE